MSNYTHRMSKTLTYKEWLRIVSTSRRVGTINNPRKDWCWDVEWDSFEEFFAEMGECPPNMRLMQYDRKKPLGLRNCQWAIRQKKHRAYLRKYDIRYIVFRPITKWQLKHVYHLID